MPEGVVQFYSEEKGYGYIRVPETREEFYVHRRNLRGAVARGGRVRFVIREGRQGLYADEVEPLPKDGQAEK